MLEMGNIIHTYRGEKKKHLIMDEIGRIDHYITKHADEEMFVFFKWKSQKTQPELQWETQKISALP